MKTRNHKKREYLFYPIEESNLKWSKGYYVFKRKSDLMNFLNSNFINSLNGIVSLEEKSFGGSGTRERWVVWYNDYVKNVDIPKRKIVLKTVLFRGRKHFPGKDKISKESKRHFSHSDNIFHKMMSIDEELKASRAKNLVKQFYKSGFKDFEPDEEEWKYINGHISDGISFWHWSDRCNYMRMKTIIEFFKREKLICQN